MSFKTISHAKAVHEADDYIRESFNVLNRKVCEMRVESIVPTEEFDFIDVTLSFRIEDGGMMQMATERVSRTIRVHAASGSAQSMK